MPFLENAWYVAGWSSEVADGFLSRTLLNIQVLFLRNEQGDLVAMHDRCPHRFAPLSLGSMVDGKLRCGYHGLEFDLTGQCVSGCIHDSAPKAARVRTFPVHEQDSIIWIWMGQRKPDDISTLLRFPMLTDSAWRSARGAMTAKVDYRIISDNLMDLTHAALLHPIFGGLAYRPKFRSWEEGDDVICEYLSAGESSLIAGPGPWKGSDVIRWRAVGVHDLMTTVTPEDTSRPPVQLPAAHITTPETDASTHYFWGAAVDAHSPLSTEDLAAGLTNAFEYEDKPMIEAVQARMGGEELFDLKPLLLPTDSGAVRVRRKIDALLAREHNSTKPKAAAS